MSALSRRSRWVVVLVVLLLLAAVSVWLVRRGDAVQVGDRYYDRGIYSSNTDQDRREATVTLPTVRLNLQLNNAPSAGDSDGKVEAPDGAAMVEVSWTPVGRDAPPVWSAAGTEERRDPGADLVLVTGGERYPIADSVTAADNGGSVVLVVEGDGSDARVEAHYGGRTARSRTGTADLGNSGPTESCSDPADRGKDVYVHTDCALPVYRGGYVPGLGAAPAGEEWLVVHSASVTRSERDVTVYPPGSDALGAHYLQSGAPTVTVRVDGVTAKPRTSGPDEVHGDAVLLADRAWLVPEGTAQTVRLRYRLPTSLDRTQTELSGQPAHHDVDVRTEVSYPAAE